jgi:hypothetical protein
MRRVEKLETLTGTRNNEPPLEIVVEFIEPVDGLPGGRSHGGFTVRIGGSTKTTNEADQ